MIGFALEMFVLWAENAFVGQMLSEPDRSRLKVVEDSHVGLLIRLGHDEDTAVVVLVHRDDHADVNRILP